MNTTVTFYPKRYLRSLEENAVGFRSRRSNPPKRSEITEVVIPDGALMLCDNLFRGCSAIEHIEIPESVEYINDNVFRDCASLKTVKLPNELKKIGKSVFGGCSSLESIRIPYGITDLKELSKAFKDCTSLKTIELPAELEDENNEKLFGTEITIYYYRSDLTF